MSNMSRLLASSRLTSHHPNVPQVYTAPPSYIARGDFGVKRPLPTRHVPIGKIRYIGLTNLDTKEGQTEWREKEREVILLKRFAEMNIKLTPREEGKDSFATLFTTTPKKEARPGSLGPKISTTYDPSTRRTVPNDYNTVRNQEQKAFLQEESRLGKGPNYFYGLEDGSSLGSISGYTEQPDFRLNFRNMSENRFAKFLEEIRSNREIFKKHLAIRAAGRARARVAYHFEAERSKKVEEAKRAQAAGDTEVAVPERVLETKLPLPELSDGDDGIQLDLWDEARLIDASNSQWSSWLKNRITSDVRLADNQQLPLVSNPRGGHEIPASQHIHGGLQYGQPDSISTQALHVSLPARVLNRNLGPAMSRQFSKPQSQPNSVAIGGRIAQMPVILSDYVQPIDTSGNDTERGNIRVKVINAVREVKSEFIEDLGFKRFTSNVDEDLPANYGYTVLTVRNTSKTDRTSLAKGIPGSTKWIASLDGAFLSSGQGDGGALDFADQDAMTTTTSSTNSRRSKSGSSQLWSSLERQSSRLEPIERSRKEKRDRLNSNTVSSRPFVKILQNNYFPQTRSDKNVAAQSESPKKPLKT